MIRDYNFYKNQDIDRAREWTRERLRKNPDPLNVLVEYIEDKIRRSTDRPWDMLGEDGPAPEAMIYGEEEEFEKFDLKIATSTAKSYNSMVLERVRAVSLDVHEEGPQVSWLSRFDANSGRHPHWRPGSLLLSWVCGGCDNQAKYGRMWIGQPTAIGSKDFLSSTPKPCCKFSMAAVLGHIKLHTPIQDRLQRAVYNGNKFDIVIPWVRFTRRPVMVPSLGHVVFMPPDDVVVLLTLAGWMDGAPPDQLNRCVMELRKPEARDDFALLLEVAKDMPNVSAQARNELLIDQFLHMRGVR